MKCRFFIAMLFVTALLGRPMSADALIAGHSCDYCHSIHSAPGTTLLNDTLVETLCLTCHGPAGISTLKADIHDNKTNSTYPAFRFSCRNCHDPHDNRQNRAGGSNIKLVGTRQDATGLARIVTPNSGTRNVMFESRTAFTTGAPEYDGVCETCHTLTARHRNDPGGNHTHQVGNTCTDCHTHANGFIR